MNSLEKPTDNVEDVFRDCISNIRNKEHKNKLENSIDTIKRYTKEYEKKMESGQVYSFPIHTKVGDLISEDLIKIYENKMAHKGQPGRNYYDKYLSIPKYGLCPYCGIGYVSTLDHFLPKTKYVSLVVTPSNLIPVCFDCNKKKNDEIFKTREDTLINPYFDNLGNDIWLKATIIKSDEFFMTYSLIKPSKWDEIFFKRVSKQFEVLKLNSLYSVHATQRLVNVKRKMIKVYERGGEKDMILDLRENLESFENDVNNWEAAMYRELLNNKWVIEEWIKSKI